MSIHYKKSLICILFATCALFSMDSPPQPIIISEGLTENIRAIENWISFLKNQIKKLPEKDSEHKSLFVEEKKAAKNLLKTNRIMLQQTIVLNESVRNLIIKNQQFTHSMQEEKIYDEE